MTHSLTLSEIHRHHDHLIETIRTGYQRLLARSMAHEPLQTARDEYVSFLREELIPHAMTEEETIYAEGLEQSDLRLLVDGMQDEHRRIINRIDALTSAQNDAEILAAASGFFALLDAHFDKENRLLLPALNARGLLPD